MTTTINITQTGQIFVTTVEVTTSALSASTFLPSACLYRFALSTNTYYTYPVTFNATLSSVSGSEEFFILVMSDADGISSLSNGVLDGSLIPSAYSSVHGTAESFELARETVTEAGVVTFDIDLAILTRFFSFSQSPDNTWNGSLLLWLCAEQESFGTWTSPSLSAWSVVDYPNRDTGGPGIQSSRYSRCPITGQRVTRGEMVIDGYRGILVHPDNYDPPEPEPREWDDYPDSNEDA